MTGRARRYYPVLAFGADPTGIETSSGPIQAAVTATPAGGTLEFPPGATFLLDEQIVFAKDINIRAYGATFRLAGALDVAIFENSEAINVTWFGGTIDGNGVTSPPLTMVALGYTGSPLASCDARDLTFINMYGGAWWANDPSNTHLRWRNFRYVSVSTSSGDDMFEMCGSDLVADWIVGTPGSGAQGVLSSAVAYGAYFRARSVDASGELLPNSPCMGLQAYSTNGTAPYFTDVEMDGNGYIGLENGNLTSNTVVGERITIRGTQVATLVLGSAGTASFHQVEVSGTFNPLDVAYAQIYIANVVRADFDVVIDGAAISGGTILAPVTIDPAATCDYITFKRLVVRNESSSQAYSIVSFGESATAVVPHFHILGGSIEENVTLSSAGFLALRGGSITDLLIRGVAGYNPAAVTSPAVPAASTAVTNVTGFDCDVYITGGAGGTTSVNGTSTGIGNGTFFVPAGGTIDLGAYTTAPTWVWVGR